MKRLGIALHHERWTWAMVERSWRGKSVVEVGEIAPEDWAALPRTRVRGIGVALSDREVVLRRLQVGHPPDSRDALRQLVRWRLRDDLPFDASNAVVDAVISGGIAFALAAPRERVALVEKQAASLGGIVDSVSCESLAAFNFLDPDVGEAELVIAHDGGYSEASFVGGALASFTLRDGAPGRTPSVDTRIPIGDPPARVAWAEVPPDRRGRFASAIGAAG